ncbi:hypothetical protein COCMIDRAFT_76332, partial [Bipolaris oryzae ATCC 44560]
SPRSGFLKNDTEPCTAQPTTPCPICHETITRKTPTRGLRIHIRNTKTAARMFVLTCHRTYQTKHNISSSSSSHPLLRPRTKSSRSNSMMRIKRCGHAFCYDCLETWVQKQNTCPMCRDRLFT